MMNLKRVSIYKYKIRHPFPTDRITIEFLGKIGTGNYKIDTTYSTYELRYFKGNSLSIRRKVVKDIFSHVVKECQNIIIKELYKYCFSNSNNIFSISANDNIYNIFCDQDRHNCFRLISPLDIML